MVITVQKQIKVAKLFNKIARKILLRVSKLESVFYQGYQVTFWVKDKTKNLDKIVLEWKEDYFVLEHYNLGVFQSRESLTVSELLSLNYQSCNCKDIVSKIKKIIAFELLKEV